MLIKTKLIMIIIILTHSSHSLLLISEINFTEKKIRVDLVKLNK